MVSFIDSKEGVQFTVKVVPGSSRTQLAGIIGQMVKIKIAAAPEKGKANDCLTAYLAEKLGVRKNAVCITSGHTSPVKQIRVEGLSSNQIQTLLELTDAKK